MEHRISDDLSNCYEDVYFNYNNWEISYLFSRKHISWWCNYWRLSFKVFRSFQYILTFQQVFMARNLPLIFWVGKVCQVINYYAIQIIILALYCLMKIMMFIKLEKQKNRCNLSFDINNTKTKTWYKQVQLFTMLLQLNYH